MSAQLFIDSNIFIYALDQHDSEKQKKTKKLLLDASQEYRIFLSTQVLNEVFAVATRKLGIDPVTAKEFVRALQDFEIVLVTPELIQSAIDCSILNRLSYWDALMVAAADTAKCSLLWSEDMKDRQVIRGVEIIDPYKN